MKNTYCKSILIRICCLMLSLLLLMPYAGAQEAQTTGEAVKQPVATDEYLALKALGMTAEEAVYYTDDAMTRGDFAYLLARMAGYDSGYECLRSFSDLSLSDYYRNAIGYLADMNVLTGAGNGAFHAKDAVTYAQIAKMTVTALGYQTLTEMKYGGYPTGYLMMADQLKLFNGVSLGSGSQSVSCQDAFRILYLLSKTAMALPESYQDDGMKLSVDKNETLFSVYHNIYREKGIMTDNGVTSLDGDTTLPGGGAIIGNLKLNRVQPGITVEPFIGENVECWYQKEGDDKTLLYVYSVQSKSSVVRLSYEDLAINDPSFGISTILYKTKNDDVKKLSVSPTHKFIYNHSAYPAHTSQDFKLDSGYMELIDLDDDKLYDVIRVLESKSDIIHYLDVEMGILKTKYHEMMLTFSEWERVTVLMSDGSVGSLYELAINQPISVFCSKDKTSLTVIDCSDSVVTGLLEEIDAGELEMVVAGTRYNLLRSTCATVMAEVSVGSSYTFYRNVDGSIFAVDTGADSGWTLAYCVGLKETKGLDKVLLARVVTTDNRVLDYRFKNKIRVNGVSTDSLTLMTDSRFVEQTAGYTVRQLLRFQFDSKGEVSEVQVAVDNSQNPYHLNLSEFSKDHIAQGSVRLRCDGVYIVAYTYLLTPDSYVFVDPYMDDINADGKTEKIICVKRTDLKIHSTVTNLEVYDLDEHLHVTAMVTKRLGEGDNAYESNIITIGRYSQVQNSNGEIVGRIKGVAGDSEVNYTMTADCPVVGATSLEPGYVFKFRRNRLGEIERLEFIYDLNDQSVRWSDPVLHPYNENMGYLYCPVYSASEYGVVTLMPDAGVSRGYTLMGTAFPNGKRNGALYDRKTKTLKLASGNDIYGAYVPANDGSVNDDGTSPWIFIRRRQSYFTAYVLVIN